MHKSTQLLKILSIVGSISIITSCGILSPIKSPEIKQYQIIAPNLQMTHHHTVTEPTIKKTKKQFDLTLFIAPLTADQPYNSTQMYYRENNYELASYTHHLWAADPGQMLSKNLLQSLQSYHSFKNIVSSNFIGYADYRLTGNLNQLTQVIKENESNIILSVSFTLTNANSGQAVAIKTFTLNKSAETNAKSFANATNALAADLSKALNNWLITQPLANNTNN
ncbi:ABC-type transport auxiliary lipoprotein family protein [Cysteiniphilum halobium]|uniref:ABC-type transport auxiliary lipoprotein family protein n=1 Tax=Cysteiniphilum halobium TaxID=2219059 RepID=UPI003F879C45